MTTPPSQVAEDIGSQIYGLIERLFPICRSITGDGLRESLSILRECIPLELHEIPTGSRVFDWTVPREWNIRDAYIKDKSGRRIVDFQESNLHVVSYSAPVRKTMSLSELKPHLHSLPDHPDWIPYRTAYYSENWGFCLSHRQQLSMQDDTYEVVIESSFTDGSLTYGECAIPGRTEDEVLLFSHICHPSLCNDNLSGVALTTHLANYIRQVPRRYSYRFVFAPATIGSITWLASNEQRLHRIKHGLVASVLGDRGKLNYKKSGHGNAEIDRIVELVLQSSGKDHNILPFIPYGYDERQFCSPGINLPVGRLTRTPNGEYEEYHTSADDLTVVSAESLADSFQTFVDVIDFLECNVHYLNTSPKCEPQLGRRGLYRKLGGYQDVGEMEFAMLWLLNMSDGQKSLLDIAERSGLHFRLLASVAKELEAVDLLRRSQDSVPEPPAE